jgi:hypothetical protein
MSMRGPVYRGEIHAPPLLMTPRHPAELTARGSCILGNEYRYRAVVNEAVDRIGDRSLKAEVRRYRGLKVKAAGFQEQIRCIEDQLFAVQMDQQSELGSAAGGQSV